MIIANGVGFTPYGSNGSVTSAIKAGSSNEMQVTFTPVVEANYLVQVYNNLDGFPVTYKLSR